jgi:histidine triad (HIT) family protein
VHLLLIPRQHIRSLNDLRPEDAPLLSHMMQTLPKIAAQQGLTDGYRTIINTEQGGGQIIFHLHIHLLGGSNLPGFH